MHSRRMRRRQSFSHLSLVASFSPLPGVRRDRDAKIAYEYAFSPSSLRCRGIISLFRKHSAFRDKEDNRGEISPE